MLQAALILIQIILVDVAFIGTLMLIIWLKVRIWQLSRNLLK